MGMLTCGNSGSLRSCTCTPTKSMHIESIQRERERESMSTYTAASSDSSTGITAVDTCRPSPLRSPPSGMVDRWILHP